MSSKKQQINRKSPATSNSNSLPFTKWNAIGSSPAFWGVFAVALLVSLSLFDLKIGVGGDDSAYIKRAYEFVHKGVLPGFQGPLYPMVLSLFVWAFGISIPILKALSWVFMMVSFRLMYQIFDKRVSSWVLWPAMLIFALNPLLQFYASQTYVESFFLMLLNATLLYFVSRFDDDTDSYPRQQNWKQFLTLGLLIWFTVLAKTVSYALLLALVAYLLSAKQWRKALSLTAIFAGISIVWSGLKFAIWGANKLQFSDQAQTLLLKNPYVPSDGKDGIPELFMRIYDNAGLYFSKHFFAFFGLRDIVGDAIGILTIFVIALIALAFYFSWKTNKFYRLIGLVVTSFFLLSFVSIQTIWDSPRLGIPYFPLLSIFIFGALYSWAEIHKKGVYKVVLAGSLILLSLTTFKSLGVEIKKDRTSISNYLRGRDLVGYTPDWVNYINMSRYAAKQLPTDKVIACRKPEISFLQTGREFYGIYRIPMHNAKAFFDSIIANQRPYIIIDEDLLESKKLPTNIVLALKSKLNAIFAGANNDVNNPKSYFFGVYFPETAADSALFQQLPQVGISLITSYPAIAQQLAQERAEMNVIYPDELLNELRTHNVGYVIMGSLRKYESQKTEFTINTERRFLYYIEQKYPNSLVQLYQIGIDEQAYLFQLRYPNQASPK